MLASARLLSRNDSNGQSEQLLVDQLGQKLRVVSAEDKVDREDGEVPNERQSDGDKVAMKEVEERKEDDGQHSGEVEEGNGRVILDDLHSLKGSAAVKSDKRDELAMMDDLDKFRAEMTDGSIIHQSATLSYTAVMEEGSSAVDGESMDDIRAWKRARHDERDSPATPSHHAASMATPWERETDGDGVDEGEAVSEFDHSQPSSPAALDESEHRLDHFAAVKLQSGYNARHEQQLDGGEQADGADGVDGMDDGDGETTLSSYPTKVRREPADEMAEHSLLTT